MLNTNNQYFYGRPPSSGGQHSTMSELDMNNGSNSNKIGGLKRNTLMQSNGMEFTSAAK